MRLSHGLWGRALTAVLLLCLVPGALASDEMMVERRFAAPAVYDAYLDVPGFGTYAYYAQNDALWGDLIYEAKSSRKKRPFRDSGCGPTAVAMALRRVTPDEKLLRLLEYAKRDYSLCACSLNKWHCTKDHPRYYLTSVRDYVRFLPLILGDFAAGNNSLGLLARSQGAGTGMSYVDALGSILDLKVYKTDSLDQALAANDKGWGVVAFAASGSVFTNTGHYMLLAGMDKEYIYFLDPLCRADYSATDKQRKVIIINQGLVAVKRADERAANLYSFTVFAPLDAMTADAAAKSPGA